MSLKIKEYIDISRILVNKEKETKITEDIVSIITYTEIINKLHTNMSTTNNNDGKKNIKTRYRENLAIENNKAKQQKIIFNNAPSLINNYFIVPSLITKKA